MRKRAKIPIGVLVIFFLAIAFTLLIVTKTNFLERRVNEYLKGTLEKEYGIKIKLGDIGGSVFSGFSISNIEVQYGEGESQYQVASIKYLSVKYSFSDLWNRRWILHNLLIDSVQVTLRSRPDGSLDMPDLGGGGGGSGFFDFTVDSLVIANSSILVEHGRERYRVDGLNLFSTVSKTRDIIQTELVSCYFSLSEQKIAECRISGTITKKDSLILAEEMRLVTDSSEINFDLNLLSQEPLDFSLTLEPSILNLREIERIAGVRLGGEVTLAGDINGVGGDIDADITLSGSLIGWEIQDLEALLTYSDGKFDFESLQGGIFGGRIEGSGSLDLNSKPGSYRYVGSIRDFNLNTVARGSFDTRLTGDVRLAGIGLSREDFRLDFGVDLDWGRFDDYTFDSLSGDFRVYRDSVVFAYPFAIFYRSTSVEGGGVIEYSGDMFVEGEADLAVIDEFRDEIFLEDIGGRGVGIFTLSGPAQDPDVTGSFNSDSVQIYDLTSRDFFALINIEHFFTEPTGQVQIFSGEFDFDGLTGDPLQAFLWVEPDWVRIDNVVASVPPFDLKGAGQLDITDDSLLLTLSQFTAELDSEVIAIEDDAVISFSDTGIDVRTLALRRDADHVTAAGEYRYDESMEFRLQYDSIRLGSWLPFFHDGYAIDGMLSGNGVISGALSNPTFELDFGISDVTFEGEPMGNLTGLITYQDSTLGLTDAVLVGARNTSKLEGHIPIDLAFETRESRLMRESPISVELSVSGTSFDLLEVFFEDLESATGNFGIDVSVSGTLDEMDMNGTAEVVDGTCKIYYIENPIENIDFRGRFDGRRLTISRMVGTLSRGGKEGQVSVSGSIDLGDLSKPNYNLHVTGSSLPVKYDLGDIESLIDNLDLAVEGDDPPVVIGDVDVAQFLYQEPFYEDFESEALEAADTTETLNYNIHISFPGNMWIKNEDTDVELTGDLIVLKEGRLENFLGELEIVRGHFYLTSLNRTFELQPGGRIRFDNIEKFNPLLEDVKMKTTIRDSSGTREVCLQISDSLENPRIDVCPGSDYTIDEVWVFMNPIGTGFSEPEPTDTLQNGSRSSIADRITVGATGMAMSQASRYISRQLGVETFELSTPAYGSNFNPLETELTIGFYTTPRLYIYGASQLTFDRAEELGFDYRLSNHVFISGSRDRDNLYELNINLSWEFK